MRRHFHTAIRGLLVFVLACEKTPFGPQIQGRDYEDDGSHGYVSAQASTAQISGSGSPIVRPTPDQGGDTQAEVSTETFPATASYLCQWNPQRRIFYAHSNVVQKFFCDAEIDPHRILTLGAPTFLTAAGSGEQIQFSGTAPAEASTTSWSFSVNGAETTGDAASLSTVILSPAGLVAGLNSDSVVTATDGSHSNGVEVGLAHNVTVDNAWDGLMTDVNLSIHAVRSDIPGMQLFDSCSQSGSYLCLGGSPQIHVKSIESDLRLKWHWSAYDQGEYFVEVDSKVTIESGVHMLAPVHTTMTVPLQPTGGNQIVIDGGIHWTGANHEKLRYNAAFSTDSSADRPVVGILYMGSSDGIRGFVHRATIDRKIPPTGTAVSVTSKPLLLQTVETQNYSLQALPGARWVAVGGIGSQGTFNLALNVFNTGWETKQSPTPAPDLSVTLTDYANTGNQVVWVDSSVPFIEADHTYIGIAFVRSQTNPGGGSTFVITVLKANVNGTNSDSVLDDQRFDLTANAVGHDGSNASIDRLRLQYVEEAGAGYFYLAFREATAIKLLKLRALYSEGDFYNRKGPITVSSDVMTSDSSTTAFTLQAIDLAVNTAVTPAIPAVVYRDRNGACKFQQVQADFSASATALALSTQDCRHPSIHYNATAGVYVVTFAERVVGGSAYEIKTVEVKPETNNMLSNPVVVVTGLSTFPAKLATRYYPEGHWMAVIYRLNFSNRLILHGYHVRGRP